MTKFSVTRAQRQETFCKLLISNSIGKDTYLKRSEEMINSCINGLRDTLADHIHPRRKASLFSCLSHPISRTLDTTVSPFLTYQPDHPKHPGTRHIPNSLAHLAEASSHSGHPDSLITWWMTTAPHSPEDCDMLVVTVTSANHLGQQQSSRLIFWCWWNISQKYCIQQQKKCSGFQTVSFSKSRLGLFNS